MLKGYKALSTPPFANNLWWKPRSIIQHTTTPTYINPHHTIPSYTILNVTAVHPDCDQVGLATYK